MEAFFDKIEDEYQYIMPQYIQIQFVCGLYVDEHDTGEFSGEHDKLWDMDHARLEFGKQNVLGTVNLACRFTRINLYLYLN